MHNLCLVFLICLAFLQQNSVSVHTASATPTNHTALTKEQLALWAGKQFASRMLWMTHQRRFVLPKGTILQVTPKITLPVFRHAPYNGGFDSDIQASWTFYMKFDKLNMTSEDHPWPFDFDRPPFYPFGEMMRPNAGYMGKTGITKKKDEGGKPFPNIKSTGKVAAAVEKKKQAEAAAEAQKKKKSSSNNSRKPRSIMSLPPPESMVGGERAIIFPSVEGLLGSLGWGDGRACLLRAVCEVHQWPLKDYGLFGELVTLLFKISESPYAESHMKEYLRAEMKGTEERDCEEYTKNCTKSIFVWEPRNNNFL